MSCHPPVASVEDRAYTRSTQFFTELGFSFDQQFSDENTTCMIISDDTYAMLHAEATFRQFTGTDVTDTSKSREVIVGLSTDTREQVDDLVDKALAAGAQPLGEPQDQGFMYMRAFRDLDGHQWSFLCMDMSAVPGQ
ncbi:MAG: VOC family protein [Jiangellaceae bacterium]